MSGDGSPRPIWPAARRSPAGSRRARRPDGERHPRAGRRLVEDARATARGPASGGRRTRSALSASARSRTRSARRRSRSSSRRKCRTAFMRPFVVCSVVGRAGASSSAGQGVDEACPAGRVLTISGGASRTCPGRPALTMKPASERRRRPRRDRRRVRSTPTQQARAAHLARSPGGRARGPARRGAADAGRHARAGRRARSRPATASAGRRGHRVAAEGRAVLTRPEQRRASGPNGDAGADREAAAEPLGQR